MMKEISSSTINELEAKARRVYFMLGTNGFIYILFFDPFHELNPMVK
jgi:hypothetical protein